MLPDPWACCAVAVVGALIFIGVGIVIGYHVAQCRERAREEEEWLIGKRSELEREARNRSKAE
jgi:hypothetical protein